MFRIAARRLSRNKIIAALLLMPSLALAFSTGPPSGLTNAPGEENCATSCHNTYALNSGPGSFSIVAPATFDPGDTINVAVNLSHSGQQRWGFEVTVLNSSNQPVGHVRITDPTRTQVQSDDFGKEYVKHTQAGTDDGTANVSPGWSFQWIAPTTTTGQVIFWGVGNAANGDDQKFLDFIYSDSTSTQGNCPVQLTGDVDLSNSISSADIIALVGYVFKGVDLQLPCEGTGDVNCDSKVSSADIIFTVNYVFKGGIPPCDVCQLIPKSWPCQQSPKQLP